jgi:hypothetical protein
LCRVTGGRHGDEQWRDQIAQLCGGGRSPSRDRDGDGDGVDGFAPAREHPVQGAGHGGQHGVVDRAAVAVGRRS